MKHPRVSIVMTVYNTERYLSESVESILNQSFNDFEFIIIDDGSTDNGWNILKNYADCDSRIILQGNGENLGMAQSLNKGLKIAVGEYIARFDSDDISLPNRLAEQISYMESNPSVDLITTAVDYINADGEIVGQYTPPSNPILIRWNLIFSNPFRHPTSLWRRVAVENLVGSYNPDFRYAEDYEFFARVCHKGTVHTIFQPLVKMRLHNDSIRISQRELQDEFAASITYQEFDLYSQNSSLTQDEKRDLRALLRRYSPLQEQEFDDLCLERFEKAVRNYLRLFENFFLLHQHNMTSKQAKTLHSEFEHHLPSLVRHGFQHRWNKIGFSLSWSYLQRYPNRILPTLITLSSYGVYYALRSIKPLDHLLDSLRFIYYKKLQKN